jgi:hypothetical protein
MIALWGRRVMEQEAAPHIVARPILLHTLVKSKRDLGARDSCLWRMIFLKLKKV